VKERRETAYDLKRNERGGMPVVPYGPNAGGNGEMSKEHGFGFLKGSSPANGKKKKLPPKAGGD